MRLSVLGGGLLERARSTTLALLGVTTAVGLAMVALALNQSWPLLAGSPIPGAPGGEEAVGVARAVPGADGATGSGGAGAGGGRARRAHAAGGDGAPPSQPASPRDATPPSDPSGFVAASAPVAAKGKSDPGRKRPKATPTDRSSAEQHDAPDADAEPPPPSQAPPSTSTPGGGGSQSPPATVSSAPEEDSGPPSWSQGGGHGYGRSWDDGGRGGWGDHGHDDWDDDHGRGRSHGHRWGD